MLMQPLLSAPIDSIGVGQENDPLPRRKAPHVEPGSIALRNLVQIEMLVFLRLEIEGHLRTPQTGHVLCDVAAGDPGREHEGYYESGIDGLSESHLLEHLIGQAPDARRPNIEIDRGVDTRPDRPDEFQVDLLAMHEWLQGLNGGEVTARMVADRDLAPREVLRPANIRVRWDHDAARSDHVGVAPHRADLLRRCLANRPMAGAGNV